MKPSKILLIGLLSLPVALYARAKFVDQDTLEVTAKGKARKSASAMRDESSCKEVARNEALRLAIETLVDLNWPNVKGKVSRKKYGEQVTQITEGSIKGAHMTASHVNADADPVTCTVTMRIERLNPAATHRRVMQALGTEPDGRKENLATPTPK